MTAVFALDGLGWLLVGLAATPVALTVLALVAVLGAGVNHASPLDTRDAMPARGLRTRDRTHPSARRFDPVAEAERIIQEPYQ